MIIRNPRPIGEFMKKLMIGLLTLTSLSAMADWSGDVLCVKPTQTPTEHKLVADAKGRILVKEVNGLPVAQIVMNDIRLYTEYGSKKGSKFLAISLSGEVGDGNDAWFSLSKPVKTNSVIKEIQFDLSSLGRGLSQVKTQKGNVYQMYCVVRAD